MAAQKTPDGRARSLANLRPFKSGDAVQRKGIESRWAYRHVLRDAFGRLGEELIEYEGRPEGISRIDAVALRLFEAAVAGKPWAIREVMSIFKVLAPKIQVNLGPEHLDAEQLGAELARFLAAKRKNGSADGVGTH